jgi:hypothetical protein
MANCLSILVEEKEEEDQDDSLDRSKRKYTDSGELPHFPAAIKIDPTAIKIEIVKNEVSPTLTSSSK